MGVILYTIPSHMSLKKMAIYISAYVLTTILVILTTEYKYLLKFKTKKLKKLKKIFKSKCKKKHKKCINNLNKQPDNKHNNPPNNNQPDNKPTDTDINDAYLKKILDNLGHLDLINSNINAGSYCKCISLIQANVFDNYVEKYIGNGLTPQEIRNVYNIPISNVDGHTNIIIIGAYYYYGIQNDFDIWCDNFNLPRKKINIVNYGNVYDKEWGLEIMLDICMCYTSNPNANIYVYLAKTPSFYDIFTTIIQANYLSRTLIGGTIISMSFGSQEFYIENLFALFFNEKNCLYVASSGDNTFPAFPAVLSNVMAVGGSSLTLNELDNTRLEEKTWSATNTSTLEAGAGITEYIIKPLYQNNLNIDTQKRAIPDISLNADPFTSPYVVYFNGKWALVGGTSASAPLMAGILSQANQIRNKNKKNSLQTLNTLYAMYQGIYSNYYSSVYYDIVRTQIGVYSAGPKYDIASGLGSIYSASNLIEHLSNI